MIQSNDLIKEQALKLKIEISQLEVEANRLEVMIQEKKYALNRLCELLEIRGININEE
ncbi:MAG: hypothetical protein ACPK85_17265 [Methanosarcina sp.]